MSGPGLTTEARGTAHLMHHLFAWHRVAPDLIRGLDSWGVEIPDQARAGECHLNPSLMERCSGDSRHLHQVIAGLDPATSLRRVPRRKEMPRSSRGMTPLLGRCLEPGRPMVARKR